MANLKTTLIEERIYERFLKEKILLKHQEIQLKKGTYQNTNAQRKTYANIKTTTIHRLEYLAYLLIALFIPHKILLKLFLFFAIIGIRKSIPYIFYYFKYNTNRYYELIESIEKKQIILQKQLQLTKKYLKKSSEI